MSTAASDAANSTFEVGSLTPLHWVGVAAAVVTALVHFALGISDFPGGFGIAFLAASVGFSIGIAAIIVGYRRRLVYLLGIPFTAGQIVLWYLLNEVPPIPPIEAVDKAAQALLIVVLIVLYRRESGL